MAEVGGWTSEGFQWRPCRHGITIVRRIRGCQAGTGELLTVHEIQAHTIEELAASLEWSPSWMALACGFLARHRRCSTMRGRNRPEKDLRIFKELSTIKLCRTMPHTKDCTKPKVKSRMAPILFL